MKKVVSILLVIVMVLSFAACSKAPTAQFKILDTEGNVLYEFDAEITDGATAGSLLEDYLKANSIDYTVDGTMLNSIGDLANDTETWSVYWAVYLNGEYGQLGLWEQTLEDGDLVELRFEESNF
ncbi:MAG: DUF4430 domain-containing protein [Oscillospiraceae bacterium]